MTLRGKLLLAQLPLAVSLLAVGALSRRTVGSIERSSQEILKDNYQSVLAAQRMRDSADAIGRAVLAQVLDRSPTDQAAEADWRRTFEQQLRFQEGNVTEGGEREVTDRVRANWTTFHAAVARLEARAPARGPQTDQYFAELEPALAALERSTAEIIAINQDAMLRKSDRARHSAERMSEGMIHCFIGSTADARKYLDLGFHLSISGVVTYKKNVELQEAVRFAPLDRLMVETDSPYLSPVPHRGKKNEPGFVAEVAKKVAELKGLSAEEVALTAARNTARLLALRLRLP